MLNQTLGIYEELIERKKILIIKFGGLGRHNSIIECHLLN